MTILEMDLQLITLHLDFSRDKRRGRPLIASSLAATARIKDLPPCKGLVFFSDGFANTLSNHIISPLFRQRPLDQKISSKFWSDCKMLSSLILSAGAVLLWNLTLTLVLRKGWLPSPREFFLLPLYQKESDLSHLGNLNFILSGHFDENKWGVVPSKGG